jgi:transcriptional regulator with XRE-family HTH domain
MTAAGELIADARRRCGMSQAKLAEAIGTTQSAIARLERPTTNPTVEMLERALEGTGHRLELSAAPRTVTLDERQIASLLELSPAERLATFAASYRNARRLLERGAPPAA